jgi:hypothetical protein
VRLEIRSDSLVVGSGLRDWIRRRLRFVLGRFGSQISRVTVHLAGTNGHAGDRDNRCRIVAVLVPTGQVSVEVSETDLHTALARAAERVGPALSREFTRRREEHGHAPAR